jgi:hypothetical protein
MKEEFINFETAKLAKEKGFDVETNDSYVLNSSNQNKFHEGMGCNNYKTDLPFICAPTQSLLQKWLRDIHSIDITVITNYVDSGRIYYVGLSYVNKDNLVDIWFSKDITHQNIEYKTHEQALEKGLFKSLKQIKN